MAEERTHFRIKNGLIEIEYDGPKEEGNHRYDKAFEWVSSQTPEHNNGMDITQEHPNENEKKIDGKKDNRGGVRKQIYPPYIKRLKDDNFFKQKKSIEEVEKKLKDMGAPTTGKRTTICNALMYDTKKEGSKLRATKEGKMWYYFEL